MEKRTIQNIKGGLNKILNSMKICSLSLGMPYGARNTGEEKGIGLKKEML